MQENLLTKHTYLHLLQGPIIIFNALMSYNGHNTCYKRNDCIKYHDLFFWKCCDNWRDYAL